MSLTRFSSTHPIVYSSSVPVVETTPVAETTPIYTSTPVVTVPIGTAPPYSSVPVGSSVIPPPPISTPVYHNSTVPGTPGTPTVIVPPPVGTGTAAPSSGVSATTSKLPVYTGAANKAFSASGAGLFAVFGLAAYIL